MKKLLARLNKIESEAIKLEMMAKKMMELADAMADVNKPIDVTK